MSEVEELKDQVSGLEAEIQFFKRTMKSISESATGALAPLASKPEKGDAIHGYNAALSLITYEGSLNWSKFNAMLVANSIILAFILSSISGFFSSLIGSCLGLIICFCWLVITERSKVFYAYWFAKAREYERRLDSVNTLVYGRLFTAGHAKYENDNDLEESEDQWRKNNSNKEMDDKTKGRLKRDTELEMKSGAGAIWKATIIVIWLFIFAHFCLFSYSGYAMYKDYLEQNHIGWIKMGSFDNNQWSNVKSFSVKPKSLLGSMLKTESETAAPIYPDPAPLIISETQQKINLVNGALIGKVKEINGDHWVLLERSK